MSDKWSDRFNALPKDIRTIGAAMEARTRIQHLGFEKDRLKKRYIQSLNEINAHLISCKKWLRELEKGEGNEK